MIINLKHQKLPDRIKHRMENCLCVICGKPEEDSWSGDVYFGWWDEVPVLKSIAESIDSSGYHIGICSDQHHIDDPIRYIEEMLTRRNNE